MSRRAWRVMLVVVLAGVIALAGAQLWRLDRDRVQAQTAAVEFETVAQRVSRAVLAARGSERAYVATGQGYAFWQPSVNRALEGIREDLSALKTAASADIDTKIDTVLAALTDVTRLEKRIVDHAAAGRLPHASDLIFADGLQASLALERAMDDLIATHRAGLATRQSDVRWQELGLTAAIGAAGLLVALLLLPLPSSQTDADASGTAADAAADGATPTSNKAPADTSSARARDRAGLRDPEQDRTGPVRTIGLDLSAATAARPAAEPGGQPSAAAASAASTSTTRTSKIVRPARPTPASSSAPSSTSAQSSEKSQKTGSWRRMDKPADESLGMPTAASDASGSGAAAGPAAASGSITGSHSTLGLGSVAAGAPPSPSSPAAPHAPGLQNGRPDAAGASALAGAAALCSALARASDAHDLDSLLPEMAEQLDAVGLIVWLRDEEGHALKAALSHGYPRQTLTALAAIDPDAENATARAARLAQPQIVSASGTTPGALVVPMLTASGCVGVVSIELPPGREHEASTNALARIFAAQLAMLTA